MSLLRPYLRMLAVCAIVVIGFIGAVPVSAATKTDSKTAAKTSSTTETGNQDISSQVTQSYNADPNVQTSMIVRLKPKDPKTVTPLNNSSIRNMLGVVVPASNAAIVLTPEKVTQQQVLVATSGHYNVLVSNQQGAIKPGDYLTISAIDGVGMKATENEQQVIGTASGSFTGTSNVVGSVKLKDTNGHTINVAIGRVPVDLNISHNPLFQKTADYVPQFLGKFATGVANKPVSAARIYLSVVILFIVSVVTGNILYSGVRNGMIAVGRNPLSKKSIMRSLIETVIAGLIIFVAGVFAVYLLVKL